MKLFLDALLGYEALNSTNFGNSTNYPLHAFQVSQAAAYDGNKYQVAPNYSHLSCIPGVLPL